MMEFFKLANGICWKDFARGTKYIKASKTTQSKVYDPIVLLTPPAK